MNTQFNACEKKNNSYNYGRWLASPDKGEEIVISGLAGSYPNSQNVYEFRDNLFNKIDMISHDDRRWKSGNPEIPHSTGKLYDINRCDAGYFALSLNEVNQMDPVARLFLEKAIEAIFDAGLNPKELEGTKTSVYFAVCYPEPPNFHLDDKIKQQYLTIKGHIRSSISNRLCYHLKLNGMSCSVDTACSSSLYAIEHAYKAIRKGECDMAIVGGGNICIHPKISMQYARLKILTFNKICKPFDDTTDGFVRSEVSTAVILQKAKHSGRCYAEIIHVKTNFDGFKEQGITFPSKTMQAVLLEEFYQECKIDPEKISYLEAHGTGTLIGDLQELEGLDEILCKQRKKPLLIGSTKSNMGHSEGASGLASITKIITDMEEGCISSHLHYKTPRSEAQGLIEGRLQVVVENTKITDSEFLAAINNFGFGGANGHILLRWNKKEKYNAGLPNDNLPRLVCVSGREENSLVSILDDIKNRSLDAEYISLYHQIFSKEVPNHPYRGYSIVSKSGELLRSTKFFDLNKKHLYLAFSDYLYSWHQIAKELLILPFMAQPIQRIHDILFHYGVQIKKILLSEDNLSIINKILGSMAVQLIIIDLLRILKIKPSGYFGYGLGELVCGYVDGALKLNQVVLAFYEIALLSESFENATSVRDLFCLEDKSIESQLLKKLCKIIENPKRRSNKWISLSVTQKASAEYFLEAFNSSKSHLKHVNHEDSIIFEIGDEIFVKLQNNIDNQLNYLNFKPKLNENYFLKMLKVLGSLYEQGHNFELNRLYPEIEYPVSRGTPMISPLIKWNHTHDWFVAYHDSETPSPYNYSVNCSLKDDKWNFVTGHIIDGRNIFPATGYFSILYEGFTSIQNLKGKNLHVTIEDCKFFRATNISKDTDLQFNVHVQKGNRKFEILESGTLIVTGKMSIFKNVCEEQIDLPVFEDVENSKDLTLTAADIYKELRLRGYNYSKTFKKIVSCNSNLTKAYVKWDGNWIIFMDNMLQLNNLLFDTRHLYVPTNIKRCSIDFKKHLDYVESFDKKEPDLPVYLCKYLNIIRCGGIEFEHIFQIPINKHKPKEPLLEYYIFASNQTQLNFENAIRINMQIIEENIQDLNVKCIELYNEPINKNFDIFSPLICKAFNDMPDIIAKITVLTNKELNYSEFEIKNDVITNESSCDLIIVKNILNRTVILQHTLHALKENGFILTCEPLHFHTDFHRFNRIQCLTEFETENERILLLRKKIELNFSICIKISNENFDWIERLQEAMKNDANIIIYSQNEPISGILGLITCIRREPNGHKIKCFFIQDNAPEFDLKNDFYIVQLKKNLIVNVYQNSKWGTYRHLILTETDVEKEHLYANTLINGNLSSFKWIESPLTTKTILPFEQELIHVYYSGLNFKDIMVATGRLNVEKFLNRIQQKHGQCTEFSGLNTGKRFMGIGTNGTLSTLTTSEKYLMWEVPDKWTLEEAATVPVAYITVLYCFFWLHKLKPGETVLIHSGAGGVGQAAIHIATHHGCTVYTTVGTEEKRHFLKRCFPRLTDEHIGNSRDTSFEQMISERTNARGVDLVLNSLTEEKLLASIRCLTEGGKFFEIGKFDFENNNLLKLALLEKSASFYGTDLNDWFRSDPWCKQEFHNIFGKALTGGYIKPIKRTVFKHNQLESAFRHMMTGKHMGKVLVQICPEKNEENVFPNGLIKKGKQRYYCDSNASYVIVGGLGGFGLELADWLVLRGARNLVLSSRKGVSDGYQSYRIKTWTSYGCNVRISLNDISTKEGCKQLLKQANQLGFVAAIFNLAAVIKDAIFENQNTMSFQAAFEPKAIATKFLDEVSRKLCPQLNSFVVFSSVFVIAGNAGQTNYGMSNSVIERICEKRRNEGLPALAIKWGAIGEVGIVARMDENNTAIEVGGTVQQKMSNCLEVLDVLLNQKHAIVSSIVLADKAEKTKTVTANNVVDTVANIIGIRNLKTINHYQALSELGMDSLSGIEIKQTLEREFGLSFTTTELRKLSFAKLMEIQESKYSAKKPEEGLKVSAKSRS